MLLLLELFLFWTVPQAHSFVELTRYGYFNCISCHASSTGGGVLNSYGRAMSKEVLSSAGSEHEEELLNGLVEMPKFLLLGGDARLLQLYQDSPQSRDLRAIVMQLDAEGQIEYQRVSLLATVGRKNPPAQNQKISDTLISRRHWISFKLGSVSQPEVIQVRGGRFFPAYGLNIPEHTSFVRRGLGFDQGLETYNLEAAWISDFLNVFVTGIWGRPDAPEMNAKRGGALQVAFPLGERSRIAWNAYTGLGPKDSSQERRSLVGVSGFWGLPFRLYALIELDGDYHPKSKWGEVQYLKCGWEAISGLHFYFTQQYQKKTFQQPWAFSESYGLGINYFPRPHWQFNVQVEKDRDHLLGSSFDTVAWILFHYYL